MRGTGFYLPHHDVQNPLAVSPLPHLPIQIDERVVRHFRWPLVIVLQDVVLLQRCAEFAAFNVHTHERGPRVHVRLDAPQQHLFFQCRRQDVILGRNIDVSLQESGMQEP